MIQTEVTKPTEHTITKSVDQTKDGHQHASPVERVYYEWDKALSENDANAIAELYADGATIESPLIFHLLGKKEGICRGKDEILEFFKAVAARKPTVRQYHRAGYLTDGKRLIGSIREPCPKATRWILSKLWISTMMD